MREKWGIWRWWVGRWEGICVCMRVCPRVCECSSMRMRKRLCERVGNAGRRDGGRYGRQGTGMKGVKEGRGNGGGNNRGMKGQRDGGTERRGVEGERK